jgi:hypothetical protein
VDKGLALEGMTRIRFGYLLAFVICSIARWLGYSYSCIVKDWIMFSGVLRSVVRLNDHTIEATRL